MLNTSARSIYNGLDYHKSNAAQRMFAERLFKHARYKFKFHAADDATGNDKYYHYKLNSRGLHSGYYSKKLCSNHQNQLIMSQVTLCAGIFRGKTFSIVNDDFANILFLKSNGHFLRMVP